MHKIYFVLINTYVKSKSKCKNKNKNRNATKNKYGYFRELFTTSKVFERIPYKIVNEDCLTNVSHFSYS